MTVVEKDKQLSSASNASTPPEQPPAREISPIRIGILLLVLVAAGFGAYRLVTGGGSAAGAGSDAAPVYSPYVDVTQTPTYPFQTPAANPVSSVYLSFVVSDSSDPCQPSWGDFYSLDQAEQSLDLDARAAQLRNQGGSVAVSYGGQQNGELAVGCTDPARLARAYAEPVERYKATAIDLDLEGETLADADANARRATAIATIQKELKPNGKPLKVWVTLPVSAQGLTGEGIAAVQSLLSAGVDLTGVNAMTMNFGAGEGAGHDMVGTIESALIATHDQVQSLWRAAGLRSSSAAVWGSIGVTPMLGVNDVEGQRFTVDDAHELVGFIKRQGIPRVSAWSLNRDSQCGGAFPRVGVESNTCSGVLQKSLQFTDILSHLPGTKTANEQDSTTTAAHRQPLPGGADDPARSPYPIWRSTAGYVAGYKIVWQGQIYQSTYWTQGVPPGSEASTSPSGPWQLIGPVPAGSKAPRPVMLTEKSYSAWSPTTSYKAGNRVSFEGLPYQARWYTTGEAPLGELPSSPQSPWEPLFTYPGEPSGSSSGIEAGVGR
jgi:chitinase